MTPRWSREARLDEAVGRYQRGECSAWRAASDAGLGLVEFLDELRKRGVPFVTDEGHLGTLVDEPAEETRRRT